MIGYVGCDGSVNGLEGGQCWGGCCHNLYITKSNRGGDVGTDLGVGI